MSDSESPEDVRAQLELKAWKDAYERLRPVAYQLMAMALLPVAADEELIDGAELEMASADGHIRAACMVLGLPMPHFLKKEGES